MSRQHEAVESPRLNRRQPLLSGNKATGRDEKACDNVRRCGEVAGGTAAECAAVCCCCPCSLMHLLVLAAYRVPAGLCRKAMRKNKRRRLMKKRQKNLLDENRRMEMSEPDGIKHRHDEDDRSDGENGDEPDTRVGMMDAFDFDSEMWAPFYGAGFWRSESRRGD